MDLFIFIIGFIGTIGFAVYTIILSIKRQKDKAKRNLKGVGIGLVLMAIGLSQRASKGTTKKTEVASNNPTVT